MKITWILMLLLFVTLALNIVVTECVKITPIERLNTDSQRLSNAIKVYFEENKQLPYNFTKIPIFKEIVCKYIVKFATFVDDNHIIIEIYWPKHRLISIVDINTNSGDFIYKFEIIYCNNFNNTSTNQ